MKKIYENDQSRQAHQWEPAPRDIANWICKNCSKLDFQVLPDDSRSCVGNLSALIEREIKANQQSQ